MGILTPDELSMVSPMTALDLVKEFRSDMEIQFQSMKEHEWYPHH